MVQHEALSSAIIAWQRALGEAKVLTEDLALQHYGANTLGISREIPAALTPTSTEDIVAAVKIAGQYRVPIYPISTGHNWGYGSANPVLDGCAIIDLSSMRSIVGVDSSAGLLTVEPGVTQRQLREYLDREGLPFLVPVHGGGPDCSLVGNALERGYGITPYADHFAAVMTLEAVLASGDVYRSALSDLGGVTVDRSFKWGVGPYLDGIFSQSNFGIVTQMTIALAPVPQRVEAFFFSVPREQGLESTVECIRSILRQIGAVTGSINLMNARRVLSMMESYPSDRVQPGNIIPAALLREMADRNHVTPWMGVGALYGSHRLVKACRSEIRQQLRPVATRLIFLSEGLTEKAARFLSVLPRRGGGFGNLARTLNKTLLLFSGTPSEVALPLAYWMSGSKRNGGDRMNPARDGCGLIWYSPLVPMNSDRVRCYVEMVESVCSEHGIEPLITLTSLSDRCFDSTVPLLFDRHNSTEIERAHKCHEALLETGRNEGFLPYRTSVQSMSALVDPGIPFWRFADQLKKFIDPKNILSPGRYSIR